MRTVKYILRSSAVFLIFFLIVFGVSGESHISNVYHTHENSCMKISLTFDDGPHPYLTPKILEILKKYNIHATFFLVGRNAELYPSIVEKILADGHEIGNHTYTHGKVSQRDFFQMKQEFECCESAIYEIADYKTKLLRPPEGHLDSKIKAISKQLDYNVILWDVDTRDWAQESPSAICKNVTENVSPGSIILMHDYISYHSPTPEAMEMFIPILLKEGYRFVVVSDLIGSN